MSANMRHASILSFLGLAAICGMTAEARASSFALREESAEGLGNAYAGQAAKAYDSSTVYYNPAGMTRLDHNEVSATATWIQPDVRFSGVNTSPLGGNVSGTTGGNAIKPAAIGSVFAVWNANPDWKVGLAVDVPYGLRSEYPENWVGRYQELATDVTDGEISPTLAYRIGEHLSIGGGPRFDYFKARLTQAINTRVIGLGVAQQLGAGAQQAAAAAAQAAAAGQTALAAQLSAQASALASQASSVGSLANTWSDGEGRIEGDDFGVGYTLGALYELDQNTRFGLNYRSRIFHEVNSTISYQTPATVVLVAPLAAAFASQPVKAKLTLPDSVNLGAYHDINPQWAVMSEVQWTHWSVFRQLNVSASSTGSAVVTLPQLSRDTWFFSVGANYKPDDQWTLHFGTAYDQTPVKDGFRSPNLPDANRIWLALGASYAITPAWTVHLAYAHLFNDGKVPINYAAQGSAAGTTGTLVGSYDNSVNIASAQVALKF